MALPALWERSHLTGMTASSSRPIASATFADNNYMDAYFGVNASQSARSGLPEYEAKAGLKRVDLKASVTYMFNENWLVTGAAGAGLLMGDAKDSPIVKDDIQPFAMLGLSYRF